MDIPPPPNLHNRNTTPPLSATKPTSTTTTTTDNTTSTTTTTTGPLPKFFILHSLSDRTLGAMSAFVVDKCLQGLVGTVQVKKLRSGDLQVETPNEAVSRSLMRVDAMDGIPISVTPHKTLNYSKGVIVCKDLLTDTEEVIQKNLEEQGVIEVKRIMLRRDGAQTPSNVHILTFNRPILPDSVKAGYLRCTVRPYIPNPLRCFLCQRYGHSRNVCRGSPVCARCAKGDHDFENCHLDPVCLNCQGSHPAYSRSCPKWQTEKAVQRYRVENNVSYPEARRAMAPTNNDRPLYSTAVQKKMVTSETQTDVTMVPFDQSPILDILHHAVPCSRCEPPRSKSTATTTIEYETLPASQVDAQSGASTSVAPVPIPQKEPVKAPKVGKGNKPASQGQVNEVVLPSHGQPVRAVLGRKNDMSAPQRQAPKQVPAALGHPVRDASKGRDDMPASQGQAPKSKIESEPGRVSKSARVPKQKHSTRERAKQRAPHSGSSDRREESSSSDSEAMSCLEGSGKRTLSPDRDRSPFRTTPNYKIKRKGRKKITGP